MAAVFQPLVRNAATDTTRNEYPSETQRNRTLAFPLSLRSNGGLMTGKRRMQGRKEPSKEGRRNKRKNEEEGGRKKKERERERQQQQRHTHTHTRIYIYI